MATEKLGNKTVPTSKEYRQAIRRIIDGESEVGDRDRFATVTRLWLQEDEFAAKRLFKWHRRKRREAKSGD